MPSASSRMVLMKDRALFMKKSFTKSGYFLDAFCMALKWLFSNNWAAISFPAWRSNWAKLRLRSVHQISAQEKVMTNVGGPRPLEMWCWIQLLATVSIHGDNILLFLAILFASKYSTLAQAQMSKFFRTYYQVLIVNNAHCFPNAYSSLYRHPMKCLLSDVPGPSHVAFMCAKGGQWVEEKKFTCWKNFWRDLPSD